MKPQDNKPKTPAKRLPYQPPAVVSEEVFETLALSCANTLGSGCVPGFPDRS